MSVKLPENPGQTNLNPGTAPAPLERKRIPMSNVRRKLEVQELPGYYLYWFLDREVPDALAAGYEPVKTTEVSLNQLNVATSTQLSGNADLGTNVKIINGVSRGNEPEYLNLMKLRMEWHLEDMKAVGENNAKILKSIFQDKQVLDSSPAGGNGPQRDRSDASNVYVKQALFSRRLK